MFKQAGRRIDWAEDGGDGPPILFVAGSFSTPSAWREMQSHLPSRIEVAGIVGLAVAAARCP